MIAHGNGTPARCANNLLLIVAGEVPYERVKGLDPRAIDLPADEAAQEVEISARWNIKTYEPRVTTKAINISRTAAQPHGGYNVTAEVELNS